ncbi:conserved membrane protein, unknown function [Hepatocystis sp. ex Piliocolobus tephrosceles]|nr:conserved membrane protein, unknown function [Hepatocystis sp. ex Piliocolobus tephrosceles]
MNKSKSFMKSEVEKESIALFKNNLLRESYEWFKNVEYFVKVKDDKKYKNGLGDNTDIKNKITGRVQLGWGGTFFLLCCVVVICDNSGWQSCNYYDNNIFYSPEALTIVYAGLYIFYAFPLFVFQHCLGLLSQGNFLRSCRMVTPYMDFLIAFTLFGIITFCANCICNFSLEFFQNILRFTKKKEMDYGLNKLFIDLTMDKIKCNLIPNAVYMENMKQCVVVDKNVATNFYENIWFIGNKENYIYLIGISFIFLCLCYVLLIEGDVRVFRFFIFVLIINWITTKSIVIINSLYIYVPRNIKIYDELINIIKEIGILKLILFIYGTLARSSSIFILSTFASYFHTDINIIKINIYNFIFYILNMYFYLKNELNEYLKTGSKSPPVKDNFSFIKCNMYLNMLPNLVNKNESFISSIFSEKEVNGNAYNVWQKLCLFFSSYTFLFATIFNVIMQLFGPITIVNDVTSYEYESDREETKIYTYKSLVKAYGKCNLKINSNNKKSYTSSFQSQKTKANLKKSNNYFISDEDFIVENDTMIKKKKINKLEEQDSYCISSSFNQMDINNWQLNTVDTIENNKCNNKYNSANEHVKKKNYPYTQLDTVKQRKQFLKNKTVSFKNVNRNGSNSSGSNSSGSNRNGSNRNGSNRNGSNRNGSNRNGSNRNGSNSSGSNSSGSNRNGSNRNGRNRNGRNRNGSNRNGNNRNGNNRNGSNRNGSNRNGSNRNGSNSSDSNSSGSNSSGNNSSGSNNDKKVKPEYFSENELTTTGTDIYDKWNTNNMGSMNKEKNILKINKKNAIKQNKKCVTNTITTFSSPQSKTEFNYKDKSNITYVSFISSSFSDSQFDYVYSGHNHSFNYISNNNSKGYKKKKEKKNKVSRSRSRDGTKDSDSFMSNVSDKTINLGNKREMTYKGYKSYSNTTVTSINTYNKTKIINTHKNFEKLGGEQNYFKRLFNKRKNLKKIGVFVLFLIIFIFNVLHILDFKRNKNIVSEIVLNNLYRSYLIFIISIPIIYASWFFGFKEQISQCGIISTSLHCLAWVVIFPYTILKNTFGSPKYSLIILLFFNLFTIVISLIEIHKKLRLRKLQAYKYDNNIKRLVTSQHSQEHEYGNDHMYEYEGGYKNGQINWQNNDPKNEQIYKSKKNNNLKAVNTIKTSEMSNSINGVNQKINMDNTDSVENIETFYIKYNNILNKNNNIVIFKKCLYWLYVGNIDILRKNINVAMSGKVNVYIPFLWNILFKYINSPSLIIIFFFNTNTYFLKLIDHLEPSFSFVIEIVSVLLIVVYCSIILIRNFFKYNYMPQNIGIPSFPMFCYDRKKYIFVG